MAFREPGKAASPEAKGIAWRAQKHLCGRYRQLTQDGKNVKLVCVAIARELVGFVCDIVRQEMAKHRQPEQGIACAIQANPMR